MVVPRLLLAAILSPALSLTAQAPAAAPSPFEGKAFSLSAADVRSAAATIHPDKLADATILFEETRYQLAPTGTLTYTHRLIYRVETHAGVDSWSEAAMNWDPWYQNAAQIHARVLPLSGDFVELDQKTITDAPRNAEESDTYTSARERKAPLPGVAVGAIVEEVRSTEEKRPYFAGGGVYRYFFTNGAPTDRERVLIDIPSSLPFHENIANLPNIAVTRSESEGIKHIVYEQSHQPATLYGDIDITAPDAPLPYIEFSTGNSWATVARDYATLADPHTLVAEAMPLVSIKPGSSRLQTIQQVVARLHKEVRYTGIEFDESQLTPQSPSEVLKRHYGDCKDKANFLVSMLRAANIPANLALLNAGTNLDVNPDLPGMNRFNHAIVYVPAAGSEPALWIDATAEFNAVGSLPYDDAHRHALIIAPTTTALNLTPDASPADSVLIETRTFQMADVGPARITESSDTTGYIDATYRAQFGSPTTDAIHAELEDYVKTAYLAKSLTSIDHGDGSNLTEPFHLKLSVDRGGRGATSLIDGAVAIFPANTLNSLPKWIKNEPTPLPDDATPEARKKQADEEAGRAPHYRIRPFTSEQRYRILVPAGYAPQALPQDRTTPLGPASLTEHYALESPGVVTATFHFTTGKATMTAAEILAFRKGVIEVYKRELVLIGFEEVGTKLLNDGKIKEGLAAEQKAVTESPNSSLAHVHLSRALLIAGVGDMARNEAALAVKLDPKSAAALTTQGWVLEHDLLGVRFAPGYDREGAIAAFSQVLPMHSEDFDPRFDLAIQSEYNANGARYGLGANLDRAITLYRDLIETEAKKNSSQLPQYRINLAYALLFNHQYKELDAVLAETPAGINRSTITIALAAAQKDAAAGIAAANHLSVSVEERNKALVAAGGFLAQLGLYERASTILAAGIQGQKDAPQVARQIEMYKGLERVPLASPPVTSPQTAVFASMNTMISGNPDRKVLETQVTEHAYVSHATFELDLDKGMESANMLHSLAANSGIDETVLRDLILGSLTLKSTGTDATGYHVLAQFMGTEKSDFFVVKEDNTYRIVADGDHDFEPVGRYALYALDHNQPALAKSILDWKRELLHKGGGDDALSGTLMPRFWTVGSSKPGADSPENMRLAAVSLIADAMNLQPELDKLVPLREKATGARRTDLDLLLAYGYLGVEQPKLALPYIDSLLEQEPDSVTALNLAGRAYSQLHDTKTWAALLAAKLKAKPDDPDLLRAQSRMRTEAHDYAAARASDKVIMDAGKATASEFNSYAWLGLFDNSLGPDITAAAQHANEASKNGDFASLHTTACVYAAQGRITEAQQVLTQAMTAGNLSQPNAAVWYVLGRLYEDYGLTDAALLAYRRVDAHPFNNHTFIEADSTYLLAQQGIQRLTKSS